MDGLYDNYNRKIDYLRISVTDRCNLRCSYCMPEEGIAPKSHSEILSYEEIEKFARAAVKAGISKIRLTGGEPLVRRDIVKLVGTLSGLPGLGDLSLTTNGLLLPEYAHRLKEAGLRRINISIDSLESGIYKRLTRTGSLERARAGLQSALELGFDPIKINTVLLRGISDDPGEFVKLIYEYPVHVRFIEFMPVSVCDPDLFLSIDEFRAGLERFGSIEAISGPHGAGPAYYATFKGALGSFGFISPISNHFCARCNRLRVTPDGKLRTCLFSDEEFDIRPIVRDTINEEETISFIRTVLSKKPERHQAGIETTQRLMSQIGG